MGVGVEINKKGGVGLLPPSPSIKFFYTFDFYEYFCNFPTLNTKFGMVKVIFTCCLGPVVVRTGLSIYTTMSVPPTATCLPSLPVGHDHPFIIFPCPFVPVIEASEALDLF